MLNSSVCFYELCTLLKIKVLHDLYFEQCMDKSNKYKTMFYFFGKQDWPQNKFLILIDQIFFGLSVQQRQTGLL